MRTQAHRIVDTDPKRGNVVVRVTGTRHDEPTYQVRQSLPNTREVPGHDQHTNRVRETGPGSHGHVLRPVPPIGSHSTWTDRRGPVAAVPEASLSTGRLMGMSEGGDGDALPGIAPMDDVAPAADLECDGEVFELRPDQFGGTHDTRLSGPNPGYGFTVSQTSDETA